VIAEGRALTRALAVVEVGACPTEAIEFCSSYLLGHVIQTVEDLLIDGALRKICGVDPEAYKSMTLEPDEEISCPLFNEGAAEWIQWAFGMWLPFDTWATPSRSELNRMALCHWLRAIALLRDGNSREARRYFRRATTLGGLYGTASNPAIQWTYAASFFPA
jgi:hypothetical protein